MQGFALSSLSIQGHKSLSASMLALPSPGNPCPCLSLTVSSVVTVLGLRPLHLWRDVCVEGILLCPLFPEKAPCPSLQRVMGRVLREPLCSLAVVSGVRYQEPSSQVHVIYHKQYELQWEGSCGLATAAPPS